jgi:hypothetical protein
MESIGAVEVLVDSFEKYKLLSSAFVVMMTLPSVLFANGLMLITSRTTPPPFFPR